MNGNSKGGYSLKTNNSGGTPGGTSRVHKIDSLTPYQNRYNKKIIQRSGICICTVTTIQLHKLNLYVCRSPKFTLICKHKSEYQTQKFNNKNYKLLKF